LSDFAALPDEKVGERAAQKIKFTRTITAKEGAAGVVEHVTLWIDKETGLPLQREWVTDTRDDPQPVRETYSDVVLDGKIDSKKFDLP
jgi:outer membrane lipoprotein-sorting protein